MSERDSDAPLDDADWNEEPPKEEEAPKSEPPPKPAGDAIRRIDTMLGSHLPALVEEEVLKQATASVRQASAQPAAPQREENISPKPRAPAPSFDDPAESPGKWRSPLQVGPDWLVALKSIPRNLVVIALGGVAVGALLTLSIRGCGGDRRYDDLSARVAMLEKTVGVSLDGGRAIGVSPDAIEMPDDDAGAPTPIAASTTSAPSNVVCANAKTNAYTAWQDALGKAKQLAGPSEAQCRNILTSQHRQSCMASASAAARLVQAARDTAMKGGAAARNAVKNVHDDARNSAIATAKAASQTAFAACPDDGEL
jgi:hypothetical protein